MPSRNPTQKGISFRTILSIAWTGPSLIPASPFPLGRNPETRP